MQIRFLPTILAFISTAADKAPSSEDCSCLALGTCKTTACVEEHKIKTSSSTKHLKPKETNVVSKQQPTVVECHHCPKCSGCPGAKVIKETTIVRARPVFVNKGEGHVYETVRTKTDQVKYKGEPSRVVLVEHSRPTEAEVITNSHTSDNVAIVQKHREPRLRSLFHRRRSHDFQCCSHVDGQLICSKCSEDISLRPSTSSKLILVKESRGSRVLQRSRSSECCNLIEGREVCGHSCATIEPNVEQRVKYVDVDVPFENDLTLSQKLRLRKASHDVAKGKNLDKYRVTESSDDGRSDTEDTDSLASDETASA
jgi:hypothetical protein